MGQELAVIGAGIVGLGHAWAAAKRGWRVELFERDRQAQSASIRNFGMVWPIGQPLGEFHDLAMNSRQLWMEAAAASGIWLHPCGSFHLAHHPDELAVLEEYSQLSTSAGVDRPLWTAAEVLLFAPGANPDGLLGGLYSPTELGVDPPAAIRGLGAWLQTLPGVRFHFRTVVTAVEPDDGASPRVTVRTAAGRSATFDRVIICSGADQQSLFPAAHAATGQRLCKLQMLKTGTQPHGWRIGPHLASGLTLRHYRNFDCCPSIGAVRERIARDAPELDRYGIHVMASQNAAGEVILGDSHEYDDQIEPFDQQEIDGLLMRELRKVFTLPDWGLVHRWHGIYAKDPQQPFRFVEPCPGVSLCNGFGGGGMTMALGAAEQYWQRLSAGSPV